jgi:hypothetical protein
VAVSAIAAPLTKAITESGAFGSVVKDLGLGGFGAKLANNLVSGVVSQGLRMAIYRQGKLDWAQIAWDAFGNAIGSEIVETLIVAEDRQERYALAPKDTGSELKYHGRLGLHLSEAAQGEYAKSVIEGIEAAGTRIWDTEALGWPSSWRCALLEGCRKCGPHILWQCRYSLDDTRAAVLPVNGELRCSH